MSNHKASERFSAEVRERAVRMVFEHPSLFERARNLEYPHAACVRLEHPAHDFGLTFVHND